MCPNDEQKLLDEERAEAFHHGVAQLLFAMPWARNNIQTAVAFLTTRVQAPDQDDWRKLRRLLQYLRGVIQMPLILRADSLNVIKWWVDASNAMHGDMRGHTGAEMLLRCGSVISMSKKKKINMWSSTKADIFRVDDALPRSLWTCYFTEEQGFTVDKMIMLQDNMSAML